MSSKENYQHRAEPELLHLCCLTCRGFKHKRITVSPPGWYFHPSISSMLFLSFSSVFFQTYYCYSCNYYIINMTIFDYFVPSCHGPVSSLMKFLVSSEFLFQFAPFSHELQLVGFSAVFIFSTHADFITMLPWTRGGSHYPHMIYSRGRNNCFHFFDVVYIYFFSILEDSVRKKSFVLFNHCIIWNTSPLSGHLCLSSHVHLDGELSLQRRDGDF